MGLATLRKTAAGFYRAAVYYLFLLFSFEESLKPYGALAIERNLTEAGADSRTHSAIGGSICVYIGAKERKLEYLIRIAEGDRGNVLVLEQVRAPECHHA